MQRYTILVDTQKSKPLILNFNYYFKFHIPNMSLNVWLFILLC